VLLQLVAGRVQARGQAADDRGLGLLLLRQAVVRGVHGLQRVCHESDAAQDDGHGQQLKQHRRARFT
jgi:hypothetical protein